MKRLNKIEFARLQRKTANDNEYTLWQLLRNRQIRGKKFRRQHPIGEYIVDFYCAEVKLVIEVDGKHHFTEKGRRYDARRDEELKKRGLRVLRFTGKQVDLHGREVLTEIAAVIDAASAYAPSSPALLPQDWPS